MKLRKYYAREAIGLFSLLIISFLVLSFWRNSKTSESTPNVTEPTTSADDTKDCGNSFSSKGGNTNTIDRNCFIEAFNACTSAKIYQEVITPENHPIKTTAYVNGSSNEQCRISVHVSNNFTIPENDIYYCYEVAKAEIGDLLEITECGERKPLIL